MLLKQFIIRKTFYVHFYACGHEVFTAQSANRCRYRSRAHTELFLIVLFEKDIKFACL